jgi:hypothetical protein
MLDIWGGSPPSPVESVEARHRKGPLCAVTCDWTNHSTLLDRQVGSSIRIGMYVFEVILALLLVATILSAFARRIGIPYPVILALGGTILAFVPGTPRIDMPPELILALFVAPVLLDAAHDVSLRDLKANWVPVASSSWWRWG